MCLIELAHELRRCDEACKELKGEGREFSQAFDDYRAAGEAFCREALKRFPRPAGVLSGGPRALERMLFFAAEADVLVEAWLWDSKPSAHVLPVEFLPSSGLDAAADALMLSAGQSAWDLVSAS